MNLVLLKKRKKKKKKNDDSEYQNIKISLKKRNANGPW